MPLVRLAVLVLILAGIAAPASAADRLRDAASPYLRSHAGDPVDWHPWDAAVFAKARAAGKPVFLSIGYLACHWCHVMQKESFTDPAVAAVINDNFIAVLVDREERPDIDTPMMRAASLMGLPTGWPLNMFLTPDGQPFYGGTYFPPAASRGTPAFTTVLSGVTALYGDAAGELDRLAAELNRAMTAGAGAAGTTVLSPALLGAAARRVLAEVDVFQGGFGTAPKFPRLPTLEFLWRLSLRTTDPALREAVILSLRAMSDGGLYDHLGGGYSRYSVDPDWAVPHFEKVLNTNAMFLALLTRVWRDTRDPLFAARARETAAFLLADLRRDDGTFASALDADSEGREGAFYVWREADVDRLLGPGAELFKSAYGISGAGALDGDHILHRAAGSDRLAAARATLRAARARRPHPQRDEKTLADWNGLAIAALSDAALTFDEPGWLAAARTAYGVIKRDLSDGETVRHTRAGISTLADQAQLATAALGLYEATGVTGYLDDARRWVAGAAGFYDAAGGAHWDAARPAGSALPALKSAEDMPEPTGNAALAAVQARLYYLTGHDDYRAGADETVRFFLDTATTDPVYFGGLLNAADTLQSAAQVVIVTASPGAARDLVAAVYSQALPGRVLQRIAPGTVLPDGQPTAYICVGTLCSLPVTTVAGIAQTAAQMRTVGFAPPRPAN